MIGPYIVLFGCIAALYMQLVTGHPEVHYPWDLQWLHNLQGSQQSPLVGVCAGQLLASVACSSLETYPLMVMPVKTYL